MFKFRRFDKNWPVAMNAASAMWESVPVRELPTIPEFDYYNAVNDSEDEENNHSSRQHHSEYLLFL